MCQLVWHKRTFVFNFCKMYELGPFLVSLFGPSHFFGFHCKLEFFFCNLFFFIDKLELVSRTRAILN